MLSMTGLNHFYYVRSLPTCAAAQPCVVHHREQLHSNSQRRSNTELAQLLQDEISFDQRPRTEISI